MRKLSVDEMKKFQVEILDVVACFCEEHGINYWIDCGTLLGAVRHKGYIPWDDDIDVGMLRPDYDRFMREFNGTNPRYEFRCVENDPDFPYPFGKVMDTTTLLIEETIRTHISIDIFIYDNAPDDDKTAYRMLKLRRLYNMLRFRRLAKVFSLFGVHRKRNFVLRLAEYVSRALLRIFPRNYFTKKIIAVSRRYISQDTRRIGNFTSVTPMLCDKRVFKSFIELEFEGKKYKAPIGYDEYLRAFYGDYMQLPPVEKRVTNHNFIAYAE